jgi:hypothetical protein
LSSKSQAKKKKVEECIWPLGIIAGEEFSFFSILLPAFFIFKLVGIEMEGEKMSLKKERKKTISFL